MIKGLHHNAYRCRDSEQTRQFYEDFLGLPLSGSLEIRETKTGRPTTVLHTFYRLDDGSYIAFFEAPDMPFEFKAQHDFDLHIALEVEPAVLPEMLAMAAMAAAWSEAWHWHLASSVVYCQVFGSFGSLPQMQGLCSSVSRPVGSVALTGLSFA